MNKTAKKLLSEYFAEIGRKGGEAKSDKKAKAVRRNGRKGAKARKGATKNGKG